MHPEPDNELEQKDQEHNYLYYETTSSQLLIIDLAGSERLKRTEAQGNKLNEAVKINSSLMVLGLCLDKLSKGDAYIPFRETK